MIKLMFCLRRLPGLTRGEFQSYWREVHAPLVRARAAVLGIERYVQCHTADDAAFAAMAQARGGHPPFDGVAELWFSEGVAPYPHEQRRQAAQDLLDDEKNFIDLPASPLFFTREHEVLGQFLDLRQGCL
ncbi:EthD domain-containing protein [Massilia cavernae]|uniref:EthD family reductase n=1 Tax=Massilia cavernae TaxID=2320864 RepID=A0A418Y0P3_9BURK|nr:EthD domain-containing protein [Massilia cavernae]RJG18845.1 EthD family reductase [Massilia cavernae]